ncbi:MAG: hypothetical protein E7523_04370 [Ruminococcaceae bacterium]|nr:hypothetical protein [Oscillospiraceae bacterium]
MSYCVNCGVELDVSAKKCVLCDTPVYNPAHPPEDIPTPYSDKVVLPPKVRRRFSAFLFSVILLLPNIVCLLIDLLVSNENGLVWAQYVNTASLLFWVLFLLPFLIEKVRAFVLILADSLAILAYIFFFYYSFAQTGWFLRVALPLVLVFAVFACITVEFFDRKKPDWPLQAIIICFQLGIYAAVCAVSLYIYFGSPLFLAVPVVISVCSIVVGGFFIYVKNSRRMRAWLSRRFFV